MGPRAHEVNSTPSNTKSQPNTLTSSFPGVFRYTGERGTFHPSVFDWLEVKQRDDDIGGYWRVHDKLYDLQTFIGKHPGGKDWIKFSRGTDITEAFESSHFVNVSNVEKILEKYYVADAKTPRNSPYTFHENGFYKTLKRRAEPVLKEVGMDFSDESKNIMDRLVLLYVSLVVAGFMFNSAVVMMLAGATQGMVAVAAHNFFHKRDNWRIFYFDLGPLSSYEWRISHAFSHHLFPNTILDYELLMGEPVVEMLPLRPKSFLHKYVVPLLIDAVYSVYGFEQIILRFLSVLIGKQKLRPENLLVVFQLLLAMALCPSAWDGFLNWMILISSSTFWFAFVSNNSSHHHPECFHDGDESRPEPDFGLCQLDATASKSDWYHRSLFSVITTFGEHPLHHLFPTVCHGKLKYLKPVLEETLAEFSEQILEFSQWQLFVGTHQQLRREERKKFRKHRT